MIVNSDLTGKSLRMIFLLIFFLLFAGCHREDPSPIDPNKKEVEINDWIWDQMNTYYYWEDQLADVDRSDTDHESYFNSLLYKDDVFSWISDDAKSLQDELDGEILALGFSPAFGVFDNSDNIFIVVEYVYPGSSAETAGLRRGDIILKIDGQDLTKDNYQELYDKSDYTITLGEYTGNGISETDREIIISSNNIEVNPLVYSGILDVQDHRIGYMVYVDFISGNDNEKLDDLGKLIDDFTDDGVTELIVDLRYNRGGDVEAAKYLGSMLVPESNRSNRDVFVRFDYNEFLEQYYLQKEGENSDHLNIRFDDSGHHLDLNQVIFLTTGHTASASELLVVGLEPYMSVTTVGESTFGKFYGSFVLYDDNDPPKHNWAIIPVVLKYRNADGFSDFVNGITPDYFVSDNLLEAKPFGDMTDPMLARAVSYITGRPVDENAKKNLVKPYREMPDQNRIRKHNIFLNGPEEVKKQLSIR